MLLLPLLACAGGNPADSAEEPFDGSFRLTDDRNYAYTSALSPGAQEVGLQADFSVDWSGLQTDLLGHTLDPAEDVDYVWLVQFPAYTEEELVALLVSDGLYAEDIGAVAQFRNEAGATSAALSEFVFPPAAPIEPERDFTSGRGAWVLRATTGLLDTRMLSFVRPSEASTNHALTLTSTSATLDFDANLHKLDPYVLAEDAPDAVADWSALTRHAGGGALDLDRLDTLWLARFDGRSVADLEADFLDIETLADTIYTADVYGQTSFALADLVETTTGAAFAGFGAHSRWLLVLRCSTCANPSPPFLTVIEVE